jgi:hypothetical protein
VPGRFALARRLDRAKLTNQSALERIDLEAPRPLGSLKEPQSVATSGGNTLLAAQPPTRLVRGMGMGRAAIR